MSDDDDLTRVDGVPEGEHGDLPRPATKESEAAVERRALVEAFTIITAIDIMKGNPRAVARVVLEAAKRVNDIDNEYRRTLAEGDYFSLDTPLILGSAFWCATQVDTDPSTDEDIHPYSVAGQAFCAFAHAFLVLEAATNCHSAASSTELYFSGYDLALQEINSHKEPEDVDAVDPSASDQGTPSTRA